MATLPAPSIVDRWARAPFYFNSAAHLLRIGSERAMNLQELLEGLRACPNDSIFQHTFQTLQEHHFIREGFSNDFAHWAFAACNEVGLAERLAAIDVREFTSITDLRNRLVAIVEDYLRRNPRARDRAALVLVHSVEGCAYQIRYLLTHPEYAAQLGRNGREHAKENFLMTSNVKRYLLLFQIMLGMARPEKKPVQE